MPAATAPLGKPAASKPTGFTKPAGLSRQTASAKDTAAEEEEAPGLQPVHLGISVVALLLAGLFAFTAYTADQTPNRVSEYLFGDPGASDASSSAAAEDDSDDGDSADSGSSSDSEEEDEEDE